MLIATGYHSRLQQLHPEAYERIERHPASYQSALAVFAHSPFLAEEILQHPDWLEELCAGPSLHQSCHSFQFAARLEAALPPGLPDAVHLARFRRRELLRILLRDVRGLAQLPETTGELSHLADAILDVTLARVIAHYARRHGLPSASLSVLAVGKLGGEELNYSSDIDLIFLYAANGDTAGPNVITNKQFAIKVAQLTTERARLAREQADAQALKNAALRRELVPAAEVERAWTDILRQVRSRVLAVPSRLRQAVALPADAVAALDRELRDALTELGRDDD